MPRVEHGGRSPSLVRTESDGGARGARVEPEQEVRASDGRAPPPNDQLQLILHGDGHHSCGIPFRRRTQSARDRVGDEQGHAVLPMAMTQPSTGIRHDVVSWSGSRGEEPGIEVCQGLC